MKIKLLQLTTLTQWLTASRLSIFKKILTGEGGGPFHCPGPVVIGEGLTVGPCGGTHTDMIHRKGNDSTLTEFSKPVLHTTLGPW